jgi:hypothetical protein
MTGNRSFKQSLSTVLRRWGEKNYDVALGDVEKMLANWPGNAHLHVLWASLVQLQDQPAHGLDEVKEALLWAAELDGDSPASSIELGYYLDAVDDDLKSASKAFSEGILSARRLLIDALLGKARVLLQLDKREEAFKCLGESLYLANIEGASSGKTAHKGPDILLRDSTGTILALELKGPCASKIEDLLHEFFPKRSA